MHKRSSSEEYLELAEICMLEAERTLDGETAERLLTMATHYLGEAKRIRENAAVAVIPPKGEQQQSSQCFFKIGRRYLCEPGLSRSP